jgi:hypothetical protein
MNRQVGVFCSILILIAFSLPAAAQNNQVTTRILRDSPSHTTIVIHDNSPQAQSRQREAAQRAQQAREAEAQRKHELELARIQADAQVQVARAQQQVIQVAQPVQAQAPAYLRPEEKKPSYRI